MTIIKTVPEKRNREAIYKTQALLRGVLFGPDGMVMIPTHSRQGDRHYRYYISYTASKHGHKACPIGLVRAGEIEGIVFDHIKSAFQNPSVIARTWRSVVTHDQSITEETVRCHLLSIDQLWDQLYHNEQARILKCLIERIDITTDGIHISMRTLGITGLILDIKSAAHAARERAA